MVHVEVWKEQNINPMTSDKLENKILCDDNVAFMEATKIKPNCSQAVSSP